MLFIRASLADLIHSTYLPADNSVQCRLIKRTDGLWWVLSAIDAENLIQLVQTINFTSEGKTVAVVRLPSVNSDLLTHALDAGIFPISPRLLIV